MEANRRRHQCACGCGALVFRLGAYLAPHTPKALRAQWAKKGNRRRRELGKLRRFRADVDRLFAEGKATKSEIVAAMALVYDRGYNNGYNIGRTELQKRSTVDVVLERLADGRPRRRCELGPSIHAVSCALAKLRAQGIVEPVERGTWALVNRAA